MTWKIYTYAWNYRYELPVWVDPLKTDSHWKLVQNTDNENKIAFFARIGNLVNFIKNRAVYNSKWALECTSWWWIEVNNWILFWIWDDKEISSWGLDYLKMHFDKTCKPKLWQEQRIQLASLLTAMKLDLWKIKWEPDVVSGYSLIPDPLDAKHQKYVKQYSHTIN